MSSTRSLLTALDGSEQHGLSTEHFDQITASGASAAEQETNLTAAALAYAGALAHGAVNPTTVNDIYTLPRNRIDVVAGLQTAVASGSVAQWLDGLAPAHAEYGALSKAYVDQRRRFAAAPPQVPEGALLQPGDADPRIESIRAALLSKGYLGGPAVAGPPSTYAPQLVAAVRQLQEDEGIAVDGVIGPDTLWALNAGPSDRARQLALNLERWRWLERDPPPTRIDVNIAAADLTYFSSGRDPFVERVVVGRSDWATPSLGAGFDRLVVNPPWNVPRSIARREILPKGRAYLRRHNMYMTGGRVVQRPGPSSALGLVKFDMQNRYAIYLHDTPSKALFETETRHRSHGCVRVRDAVGFARRLSEEHGVGAEFERALQSGRTRIVRLGAPIAVRLLYRTAFMREGRLVYTPDPYQRDEKLAAALGLPSSKRPSRVRFSEIPLGP